MTNLDSVLRSIKNNQDFLKNLCLWQKQPSRAADFQPIPSEIHPFLQSYLKSIGIEALYSHQFAAIREIQARNHVVISTGTASGKSLCYQIPVIDSLLKTGASTSLLLFPTKALTYDQLDTFTKIFHSYNLIENQTISASVYDGDTPLGNRSRIKKLSKIILTNPDMLNIAILPHHTNWADFLQNLKYVVIDEIHLYRGVFGSHIANLIRRLKRVCKFYNSDPCFIMTSATIANPKILATNLIEESIVSIEEDGSPSGEKNFLIYNPPLINRELGIRESLLSTTTKIAERFLDANTQTLVFCQSRRFVEQMVKEIHTKTNHSKNLIRGYRSGYLKRERREIEEGLKNGSISMAVATNALELGVDIGGVDVVLLAGYPGSIASLRQRSGRAGRSTNNALSILITGMNPLDQYFARYPEYLTGRPLEQALIDANNPLILLSHIKCAAFELPFEENDKFGNLEWNELEEFLEYLCETGTLQKKKQKYFWLADGYPSSDFSIRSTAAGSILLQCKMNDQIETIGEVDYSSGLWMTHPGAIYLHDGESYYVNALDLEKSIALLSKSKEDYLTEPILSVDINVISQKDENDFENFTLHFGEIEVRSQVTGFNKVQFRTREILGEELLDLPVTKLQTFGCWIELTDNCVNKMKLENLWFSDPIDYGLEWKNTRNTILERDKWTCQSCGKKETAAPFHVHHKIPFKTFILLEQANNVSNLITLCPDCHAIAELNVRIRSGLSGLRYVMSNLAPMLVLCDSNDLGSFSEPKSKFSNFRPVVLLYDSIPGGVGLSEALFRRIKELFKKCLDLVKVCDCQDGCPSCVGPVSESGAGGKKEALYLLSLLLEESKQ